MCTHAGENESVLEKLSVVDFDYINIQPVLEVDVPSSSLIPCLLKDLDPAGATIRSLNHFSVPSHNLLLFKAEFSACQVAGLGTD